VIVGRGADAAGGEHHGARFACSSKGARERRRDARRIVAHILGPGQREAAHAQQFDEFGQVLVGALARENFIADHDETEVGSHTAKSSSYGTAAGLSPGAAGLSLAGGGTDGGGGRGS
jgi:hypothetical protein